jgi:UDP-3-O-[3-hydroxymyristoyl] glucosamine N-acyltransferase
MVFYIKLYLCDVFPLVGGENRRMEIEDEKEGVEAERLLSEVGVVDYHKIGIGRKLRGVASLKEATEDDLSFCWYEGETAFSSISGSKAGAILCPKTLEGPITSNPDVMQRIQDRNRQQLLFLDNPRLAFVQVTNKLLNKNKQLESRISPHSIISKTAKTGSNCIIGDFAKIGDNCTIGNNTVIGDGVKLVVNCSIGDNCTIQPGVIIGADGFAFERHPAGELERFPHLRGVRIGNNVEICSNSSVARGSLSDTEIGDGTKIDALVHIAHNVTIGKHCELTAGTIIGGSTVLGDMCWTGLNSTLKDNIKIGSHVIIASGASVIRDVEDGDIVAGVPAKSIKDKVTTDRLFLMRGNQQKQQQQ